MWLHYRVFYSRSFKECRDLIFKGRSGQQECREGCFLFEHSSWTVLPFEDENTPEQWIPNNEEMRKTTQLPCRAVLRDSSDYSVMCKVSF